MFDRTTDGRILQRNFGGHRYPRLAHVGDRTGLELIRTLQDHGVHQGIDVYMECTVVDAACSTASRVAGGARLRPRARALHACSAQGRSSWRPAASASAYKITSNSWEYTGDGHALAYDAGAELIDMEFIQFHPTGMVWPPSVRGILVTEGVRGEGGVLQEQRRPPASCSTTFPTTTRPQTADDDRGRLALHARATRTRAARPNC